MSFVADLKFAFRSFTRARGLALTVIVTLALGIGANAAMFSVVRVVLLRPLVNRDESRLIYIRQSAPGIDVENATFSIPELVDLRSRMKTVTEIGDFSTIGFTMVGLGEPRVVRSGVVGGSYFDVMGLRPVSGRLIDARDDGPNAAPVVVLTHRFWTTGLGSDPNVIGKTVRLGSSNPRSATVIGILEPCVPYPTETEIIANVVTSPHHLGATMVTGRTHRMTELFARLAPAADLEAARTSRTRSSMTCRSSAFLRPSTTKPGTSDFEGLRIAYRSGSLRIVGFIYKPKHTTGRKLPAIIFNRGGTADFGAIEPEELVTFYFWAKEGFVVLASNYRGGGGSEGVDEWGGRDVDDVMNLMPLARDLG